MNRTKKFIDGIVLNYGYQGVVMIVGLWLTPFLLHHLGQHDYGVWLVGLQSLTYLSLLDIGVIGLLPREVAHASGRIHLGADAQELRTLLEENAVVVLWQTPILFFALAVAWFLLRHHGSGLQGVFVIILATYGIQFPLRIFFAALEGLQDFAYVGYLQMAAWGCGVIVNVALVYLGFGLYGLAFGWSITQAIIAFGSIWRMYARHVEYAPRALRWLEFSRMRKYLQSGFWISIAQVTQMLVKGADVVLLAGLRGPGAVVPYSCSTKLQMVLANQPQVILQAAQPGLTQLRTTASREHIGRVIGTLAQAMLMISGAVAAIILAVNKGFVQKWVGPEQFLGFWFTVWITVGMLLRHLNGTTIYSLFCFGRERFISIIGLCDGVCFAVMTYFFVRLFGTIGIPLASIASVGLVSLPWTLRELQRVTGLSVWTQLAPIREWFLPFSVVGVAVGIAVQFYNPSTYWACAVVVVVVFAIYFAVEFPVIRRSLWGARLRHFGAQFFEKVVSLFRFSFGLRTANGDGK
jgi:O-antigen/teichoic acid export membrane protein